MFTMGATGGVQGTKQADFVPMEHAFCLKVGAGGNKTITLSNTCTQGEGGQRCLSRDGGGGPKKG